LRLDEIALQQARHAEIATGNRHFCHAGFVAGLTQEDFCRLPCRRELALQQAANKQTVICLEAFCGSGNCGKARCRGCQGRGRGSKRLDDGSSYCATITAISCGSQMERRLTVSIAARRGMSFEDDPPCSQNSIRRRCLQSQNRDAPPAKVAKPAKDARTLATLATGPA